MPAVKGMAAEGIPYTGFLYAGLMIDAQGNATGAGIQLPHGRPGNPAHHAAPEERLLRDRRARHQRHAGPRSKPNGTGAPRWAWCSPRRATPTRRARATRSTGCRRTKTISTFSTPAPRCKDGKVVTNGGRVLCVTALGDKVKIAAEARLRGRREDPLRRHAVPHRHRPPRVQPPLASAPTWSSSRIASSRRWKRSTARSSAATSGSAPRAAAA